MDYFLYNPSFHNSFIFELGQHLKHVDADLLRIIIQTGADDAEAIRGQDTSMQLVGLVLLVFLIFFIRYLLYLGLLWQIEQNVLLLPPTVIFSNIASHFPQLMTGS